jgi:hypothetical protein
MELQQRLLAEMKEGMKSGDTERVGVIRMLRSTLKNKEIEKRPGVVEGQGAALAEDEVLQVIAAAVKQRNESITLFESAGRTDLVEKEQKEVAILESFLPQPLSEMALNAKISEAILEAGATTLQQMGEVMKVLKPHLVGRADMQKVSVKVRACLTQTL